MRCNKLPRPDSFTQSPTCYLYFSYYFAGILFSVCENSFIRKTDKRSMQLSCTCVSALFRAPSGLLLRLPPIVQVSWRYRLSWRSSDRCLLRTGALLRSALDRWRFGAGVLRCSSTLRRSSQLFFRLGTWNPSCSTPGLSLPRLMLWWRTRRAPPTDGPHLRFFAALLVGSSVGGISRTSAPLQALSTVPMSFSLSSNRQSWGTHLGHLQIPGRPSFRLLLWPRSLRACAAGGSLHTGAIRSTLGRWCLRKWRSTALSWPTGCLACFLPQRGSSSL